MALSKEIIANCALEICEEKGFEAISMRLLAKKLDVTPMALYKHISTKNELLNLMASEYLNLYRGADRSFQRSAGADFQCV